ncbi:MAG: CAP domain-containing protein, partial [Planctomycetes bacterium]|nr:CAP domain-containing protein [Planctomycetota bacterium]
PRLADHRYREVVQDLEVLQSSIGAVRLAEKEWFREFREEIESERSIWLLGIQSELDRLAEDGERDAHAALLDRWRAETEGTPDAARLPDGADFVAASTKDSAGSGDDSSPTSTEAVEVASTPPLPDDLSTLLEPVLASRKPEGRRIQFEGFRARVVESRADALVIERGADLQTIPAAELPPLTQLELALDLDGSALMLAARVGYRWRLDAAADRLLAKYWEADPAARQSEVDALLASIKGSERAGFRYSKEHGWEDLPGRREREIAATIEAEFSRLSERSKGEERQAILERIAALRVDPDLSDGGRASVTLTIAQSLSRAQVTAVTSIEKSIGPAFTTLRAMREELQRRRDAATKVIFDPTIYLPEDHEDWGKGDVVNGQRQVDELVGRVRELWDDRRYDVALSANIDRLRSFVAWLESEAAPALEQTLTGDSILLADLLNNPGPRVELREFALDTTGVEQREFDRQASEYNRAFRHDDVPEQDRLHVIFMNDHRAMMGVARCVIDVRLCRATRKHSRACDKAGRIWHAGGGDGDPNSRARDEGFEAGVGENVAIGYGNPKDIWTRGWYRASDHHRNAIGADW